MLLLYMLADAVAVTAAIAQAGTRALAPALSAANADAVDAGGKAV